MNGPWCVLLASREDPQGPDVTAQARGVAQTPARAPADPMTATLRRAATVTSLDRIAAVIAPPAGSRQDPLRGLGVRNFVVQPRDMGTAYEVLLALLTLETRLSASTTVLFLPGDFVVDDEEVMTNSLMSMAEWISDDPGQVYLLGAVAQGPHDQLGYIVPWNDAMLMPTSVYEFVERPDVFQARKLIQAGGLWNTFIFGASVASLIQLFRPEFDGAMTGMRAALRSDAPELNLVRAYDGLTPADFSRDVLARQTDNLRVLRLLRCGWWPLKSPKPAEHGGSGLRRVN